MNVNVISTAINDIINEIEPGHTRPGLATTGADFAAACHSWFNGYGLDPQAQLNIGAIPDSASDYNHLVRRQCIPFFSFDQTTFVPFVGHVSLAYVPAGRFLSPTSLDLLVQGFAARLTSPEQLAVNIADAIATHGLVAGAGVVVRARSATNAGSVNTGIVTSKVTGLIEQDPALRAEFFSSAY